MTLTGSSGMDGVALVTGGSSGIGAATVKSFLTAGVRKIVVGDYSDALPEAVKGFSTAFPDATVLAVKTDVSDEAQVKDLIKAAVDKFGRIDYAVNCAGIAAGAPFAQFPTETWDKVVGVNERGLFFCVREQIAQMEKQDFTPAKDERRKQRGAIVNIASVAGLFALPNCAAYVASKHAVAGLTKVATFEYAKLGIRVNAIAPGWIDTPMTQDPSAAGIYAWGIQPDRTPLSRGGVADEIGDVALFLCSEAASFVAGAVWNVDGGYSCI